MPRGKGNQPHTFYVEPLQRTIFPQILYAIVGGTFWLKLDLVKDIKIVQVERP
jgi:hypothetical protein